MDISTIINVVTTQCCKYYINLLMNVFAIMNVFISQLRWYCAIISMDEFRNINAFMVQLGTSCSFDSPGLARNEPTPGKHSQGGFNAVGVELFLWKHGYSEVFYVELRLESVTPTALVRPIRNMNYVFLCLNLCRIALTKRNTYGVEIVIFRYDFFRLTTCFNGLLHGNNHYLRHWFK